MKNIIALSLLLVVLFPNCKKKEDEKNKEVWCVYKTVNGNRSLYKCCSTQDEATQAALTLRDSGQSGSSVKKSNCSDC